MIPKMDDVIAECAILTKNEKELAILIKEKANQFFKGNYHLHTI
jgi:hypothetical protein